MNIGEFVCFDQGPGWRKNYSRYFYQWVFNIGNSLLRILDRKADWELRYQTE